MTLRTTMRRVFRAGAFERFDGPRARPGPSDTRAFKLLSSSAYGRFGARLNRKARLRVMRDVDERANAALRRFAAEYLRPGLDYDDTELGAKGLSIRNGTLVKATPFDEMVKAKGFPVLTDPIAPVVVSDSLSRLKRLYYQGGRVEPFDETGAVVYDVPSSYPPPPPPELFEVGADEEVEYL